jgi:nitrate reductase delta subunit
MSFFDTPAPRVAHSLRALAWLLRYPDAELRAALPALIAALRAEDALPAGRLDELDLLATRLATQPALRVEADYVDLFDRSRQTALHLFASTQPPAAARAFLGETAHIVRAIFSALIKRNSGYASVLAAVLDLAGEKAEPVVLIDEPPLDESWEEPAAFGGCSSAGQSKPGQPQPIQIVRPATAQPQRAA